MGEEVGKYSGNEDSNPESQGGLGAREAGSTETSDRPAPLRGLFHDRRHRREDLRLLHQALNNGWDPENKQAIVEAVQEILAEPDQSQRVVFRCVTAMLKMAQHEANNVAVLLGGRVEFPRMLTPWQRQLRAALKADLELRRQVQQAWVERQHRAGDSAHW